MSLKDTDFVLACAQSRIGRGIYHARATLEQAPDIVNCFRFVQWVWAQAGIVLPEHILIWPNALSVSRDDAQAGDLVFTPRRNRSIETDDFGHVGILDRDGFVIHATKWRNTVVEDPPAVFFERGCLGVRRVPLPR